MKIFRSRGSDAVSPVIAVILMVAITVVLASLLYVWVMNFANPEGGLEKFATLEIELRDEAGGDQLVIKLIDGDPINWTNYKIIIYNDSDDDQVAQMLHLNGDQFAGDKIVFNATNAPGFSMIDYKKDVFYHLEIYNIKESKRVYKENYIICTVFLPS